MAKAKTKAKEKYQIIMMTLLAGPKKTWNAGKVLDVPLHCSHDEAEQLIAGNYAKVYISKEEQEKIDHKAQKLDDSENIKAAAVIQAVADKIKTQEAALQSRIDELTSGLESIEEQEKDLESRKSALAEGLKSVKDEETALEARKESVLHQAEEVSELETAAKPAATESAEKSVEPEAAVKSKPLPRKTTAKTTAPPPSRK